MTSSIFVKVKVTAAAKKNEIIKKKTDTFDVFVKEKAENGQANRAVIQLLVSFFSTKPHLIRLAKGGKNPHKIFEILKDR